MSIITEKNVKQIIIELSKKYRIKVFFNKRKNLNGEARFWRRSISINENNSPTDMLSIFFHEVGHVYCFDNNLWISYHNPKNYYDYTDREKQLIFKTAIRAEKWIDKWAEKEMKKHFPDIKYYGVYNDKDVVKSFREDLKKELCIK